MLDSEEETVIHMSAKVETIEQAFGWIVRQLDSKPIKYPQITITPANDENYEEPVYWACIHGELDNDITIISNTGIEGSHG